jgi:hypothetical protein
MLGRSIAAHRDHLSTNGRCEAEEGLELA